MSEETVVNGSYGAEQIQILEGLNMVLHYTPIVAIE